MICHPGKNRVLCFAHPASIIRHIMNQVFPPPPRQLFGIRLRTLAVLAACTLIGVLALALDLANQGLVYDYLWSVTGETNPPEQILGFAQYLTRFTRQQPDTEPFVYMPQADVNPFGVNTFLEQEVKPERRERQVREIAEAGFTWIRQQFPWEDIEHHAKGDFTDRRNDLNGDGIPDTISAWDKYDSIVDLVEKYHLNMLVRLSAPPNWSQPPGTPDSSFAPPADFQDFVDFAVAVAARYRGRLRYYQIWNEPNLYPEWGEQTVNAEAYTDLLCRTYAALKAVDPQIVVVTGALGPTVDLSGVNASDILYLQRMYQAGAGDCFDVLSVQGYGLWSGPTDRRLRQVTINFQRHLWIRDVMVAHGDADKAIWISEAGWNPVPDDPAIADRDRYGRVTDAQAAEWAPLAYQRAQEEWPWIGVITYWFFKEATEDNRDKSPFYFRLLDPDFTPRPVFESLKTYMTSDLPKPLGAGRWGTHHRGEIRQAEDGREARAFRFNGTGLYLCAHQPPTAQTVQVVLDGSARPAINMAAGASGCLMVSESLSGGEHWVTFTAEDWTGLDSLVVIDHSTRHRLPWLLTGLIASLGTLTVLGHALRVRRAR